MDKIKIKSKVKCKVIKDGKRFRFVLPDFSDEKIKTEEKEFLVLGILKNEGTFLIEIPHDWIGWTIGKFAIEYQDVPKEFLGRKFYELESEYFV